MLVRQLDLTAQNAKTELTTEMQAEFFNEFARSSAPALEHAFRTWRRKSPFMPAISDIAELVTEYSRRAQEEALAARSRADKTRDDEARRSGNLLDMGELKEKLAKIAASAGKVMPRIDDMVKPMAKPRQEPLTDAQIADRREMLRQQQEKILKKPS